MPSMEYAVKGMVERGSEERRLERAKKMLAVLAVPMDTEVVRLSLERAAEMEEFWRFMQQNRRILKPGSIKSP